MSSRQPGWRPLRGFRDRGIAKLFGLRRAWRAGIAVPPTWWARAEELRAGMPPLPESLAESDIILRSGSPDEDTAETSHAGQLHSEIVPAGRDPEAALERVLTAMGPGVVFVQPVVAAERSGVAFFDGFHYERSLAAGLNQDITAGARRGETTYGHLQRGERWSQWLEELGALFLAGRDGWSALDIEFADTSDGFVLLQARPALFEVSRAGQTLSLANHREILGEWPSPWIVSSLAEASEGVLDFFVRADPSIAPWATTYAVELGERGWMSFGFFFRLMDHWGLPRSFVTEGVGGDSGSPADRRPRWGRMARKMPRLLALQVRNFLAITGIPRALATLDEQIAQADTLPALFEANVLAMATAVRSNFAINGALTGAVRIRAWLGLRRSIRVITQTMMEGYEALATLQGEALERGLDIWLAEYGHRGPLESDPAQPRFAEMRDLLLADLSRPRDGRNSPSQPARDKEPGVWAFLYRIDRRRERFRDELMQRWKVMRSKTLDKARDAAAAGWLDSPEDVFWLHGSAVRGPPETWREAVAARKAAREELRDVELPTTATQHELEAILDRAGRERLTSEQRVRRFEGISLGPHVVEGTVLKASDLRQAMASPERLTVDTILVVPALEPSWALVFPRVGGVVADLGGELSHASILLREARRPALVNCRGAWRAIEDGMRVRLDGRAGCLEIL